MVEVAEASGISFKLSFGTTAQPWRCVVPYLRSSWTMARKHKPLDMPLMTFPLSDAIWGIVRNGGDWDYTSPPITVNLRNRLFYTTFGLPERGRIMRNILMAVEGETGA